MRLPAARRLRDSRRTPCRKRNISALCQRRQSPLSIGRVAASRCSRLRQSRKAFAASTICAVGIPVGTSGKRPGTALPSAVMPTKGAPASDSNAGILSFSGPGSLSSANVRATLGARSRTLKPWKPPRAMDDFSFGRPGHKPCLRCSPTPCYPEAHWPISTRCSSLLHSDFAPLPPRGRAPVNDAKMHGTLVLREPRTPRAPVLGRIALLSRACVSLHNSASGQRLPAS